MTQTPYPQSAALSNEQQLVQNALARVRALFRGNGVKQENIQIASHRISRHTMNAGTYLELKPAVAEKNMPGKLVSGQQVQSREDAMRQIEGTMVAAASNATVKAQITSVLLQRPDQGFGLSKQVIPLDFLKKDFSWQEGCSTCHGTAQAPCQRCQGKRTEPCTKCSGRGLMICPTCRATGLLQGQKCSRCFGQRYVPCDLCQRSGMMRCRVCNATGTMKCPTCAGQGWKTYVLSLSPQAVTYFEYDAKAVPKPAADVFETQAPTLIQAGKIKVLGRIADDKENVLGANYEVEFPFGEVVFALGKKEVKASIFGFKGDIVGFPYVLDKMIGPAVEELEEAANDVGNVAGKIKKATRYRVIAQGFLSASRTSTKKTIAHLMKLYDIGLSLGMAEKIALLADSTTSRITRKPRYYGLVLGLAAVAAMDAAYYLLPARSKIASYLPSVKFDFVLDILPMLLGGFITLMAIQFTASGAIRKALGHLMPKGQKSGIVPKAGSVAWWGHAGAVLIPLGMMEAAASYSTAPYWYELARNFVLQTIGG
ncbi:MAG: hypothetical protein DI551_00075 [Micavibrio aeruginosavorus]|uniref:CR-type domain-containing protein n=1 Tax=Micavibrio aeruginosavorus TaxID=349221 RepID=A0A2W5N7S1_9BACT|nr:MAG: hypothetical protein DI551_00075 [Micavibrio aeruginosavorus]